MEFNLTRDRGWTFADPLADRFERHALCTTFLNLNTIVKRHVLVFLFASLHLFEHTPVSQTKCYRKSLLNITATFSEIKLHCCIYFENLLSKNLQKTPEKPLTNPKAFDIMYRQVSTVP